MKSSEYNYYITYNQGVIFMNGIYEFFTKKFIRKANVCAGLALALFVFAVPTAFATEPNDSIDEFKQLDEIVVEGQNQSAKAGELSFIPTKRQKEIARDGYDLLRHLAMPQIRVDDANKTVTSNFGGDVALYINYLPATEIEVQSLRVANIMRVDYLDFPSDPHFQGAMHVINFILKEPQGGGYTRLNGGVEAFGNTAVQANLFSKYIYKRMSYDLYLGWDYTNSHHGASSTYDTYSLLSPQGSPYEVEDNRILQESRGINKNLPVSFRAVYNTSSFQASNTLHFTFNDAPVAFTKGERIMTPPYTEGTYSYNTPYTNRNVTWKGFYYLDLGHAFTLSVVPGLSYSHNNEHRVNFTKFLTGTDDVVTDSKEDAWNGAFAFMLRKQIAGKHAVGLAFEGHYSDYDIVYTGTLPSVTDMNSTTAAGVMSYSAKFPFNLQLSAGAGGFWNRSEVNNNVLCAASPFMQIYASYSPNSHHQMSLMGNYTMQTQGDAMRSSNILQDNMLLYITGNPSLKPVNQTSWTLSYVWMPDNKFFAQILTQVNAFFNQKLVVYSHYNDGKALLRSYANDGDAYSLTAGLTCTYKPIEMLQFSGSVAYEPQKRTGSLNRTINPVNGYLSATVYKGRFFASLFGGWASRSLSYIDGEIHAIPWYYTIQCGWGNGAWNVQLRADNLFSSNWLSSTSSIDLPLYSSYSVNYSNAAHRKIGLTVSYTFDYGKKVKHGDELQGGQSGPSAILK